MKEFPPFFSPDFHEKSLIKQNMFAVSPDNEITSRKRCKGSERKQIQDTVLLKQNA